MKQTPASEPHDDVVTYSFGEDCRRSTSANETFNGRFDREPINLNPGDVCCLEDTKKMLVATVGAGVCLTIFDQKLYFGVMAYPLITPEMSDIFPRLDQVDDAQMNKVMEPIEMAINEMKKRGAGKNRIRIRLFGGANLQDDKSDAGTKNYVFVKEYLKNKNLQIMGEDIGGEKIRRVHFLPDDGSVTRFALNRSDDLQTLQEMEQNYFGQLQ